MEFLTSLHPELAEGILRTGCSADTSLSVWANVLPACCLPFAVGASLTEDQSHLHIKSPECLDSCTQGRSCSTSHQLLCHCSLALIHYKSKYMSIKRIQIGGTHFLNTLPALQRISLLHVKYDEMPLPLTVLTRLHLRFDQSTYTPHITTFTTLQMCTQFVLAYPCLHCVQLLLNE